MKNIVMLVLAGVLVLGAVASQLDAEKKSKGTTMMASSKAAQKNFFDLSGLEPSVVHYSGEKSAMMSAKNGTTVYFFAASWCPTCKSAYKNIAANSDSFPENFRLIFVNYDTEKKLAQKYGVSYQHTFVSIDENGGSLKKWSGSMTVDDIVMNAE